jgi:hypothetical protein
MPETISDSPELELSERLEAVSQLLSAHVVVHEHEEAHKQQLIAALTDLIVSELPVDVEINQSGAIEFEEAPRKEMRMVIRIDRRELSEAQVTQVLTSLGGRLGATLQFTYGSGKYLTYIARFDVSAHAATTVSEVVSEDFSFAELAEQVADLEQRQKHVLQKFRLTLQSIMSPVFPDLDESSLVLIGFSEPDDPSHLMFKVVFEDGNWDRQKMIDVTNYGVQLVNGAETEFHGSVEISLLAQEHERLQDELASFSGEISADVAETLEQE